MRPLRTRRVGFIRPLGLVTLVLVNVAAFGMSYNCDGQAMVELGSFRAGRSDWEAACS
jgi:hypothetical protein